MATPRDGPYVWVTWISRLMAGEAHCEWAAWFRAHHRYDKVPSDFDTVAWTARHTELVRTRADALRAEGCQVTLEAQNKFNVTGRTGIVLSGKPDIVAVRDGETTVVDCKTGTPKMSDQMQVLIYMLVLPHGLPRLAGRSLGGEVRYSGDAVAISPDKVTAELRELFGRVMQRVGGADAPPRVPSWDECRFCDITAKDCPQRVEAPPAASDAAHDLF